MRASVMEHDVSRYESPEVFRPQRFMDEKGQLKPEYRTATFGFGRRRECPSIEAHVNFTKFFLPL